VSLIDTCPFAISDGGYAVWLSDEPAPAGIDATLAQAAWRQRLNRPATSSVGRLFDAVAAFLGLVEQASYEGEGPMAVEAIAAGEGEDAVALPLQRRGDGVLEADWAPLVASLLNAAQSPPRRAAAFHASMALLTLPSPP
jgi:hydrogenase maturation protein HypF